MEWQHQQYLFISCGQVGALEPLLRQGDKLLWRQLIIQKNHNIANELEYETKRDSSDLWIWYNKKQSQVNLGALRSLILYIFQYCVNVVLIPSAPTRCPNQWLQNWPPGAISIAWWRHQMETFSALLPICAGNSPVPGEFPTQRPVTRSFDVFFDLRLNKPLNK